MMYFQFVPENIPLVFSGEWMVPVNRSQESQNTEAEKEKKEESNEAERAEAAETKGDPEMAPFYVQHLLPVFTDIFHASMLASVRLVNGLSYLDVPPACLSAELNGPLSTHSGLACYTDIDTHTHFTLSHKTTNRKDHTPTHTHAHLSLSQSKNHKQKRPHTHTHTHTHTLSLSLSLSLFKS